MRRGKTEQTKERHGMMEGHIEKGKEDNIKTQGNKEGLERG